MHHEGMASPPEARNSAHGAVYGNLLQARDIHGSVTVNAPQVPPEVADVSLDPPRIATAVRGREELLAALRAAMLRGAPVPHVLTGPGGFGKTTVAAALAEHARSQGWTVFWVRPNAIMPSLVEAAIELGGPRQEAEGVKGAPRQAARWAWRHLDSAPRPWLLVIDNADRPEELDPENRPGEQRGWMRSSPGGFVLVTSRVDDPALWAPATMHRVQALCPEDAAVTLTDHAGVGELPGTTELAGRLGGVPIALSLAGRILATHQVLFPDARALLLRLEENITELDELAGALVTGADVERKPLSGVWDLSLRLVTEQHPQAVPLLRILAVMGSDAFPVPLRRLPLSETTDDVFTDLDEAGLARTINALVVHGLVIVGRRSEEASLRVHPLVSETIRANLTLEHLPLLEMVERLLRRHADRDLLMEMSAYTILHGLLARFHGDVHPSAIRVNVLSQRALMLLGHRKEAARNLREIVDRSGTAPQATHPEHLRARHALADALRELDDIEEAEEIYRSVTREREATLGPKHPDTLSSRHQIALMAALRGDLETAEKSFRALRRKYAELSVEEDPIAMQALVNLSYISMLKGDHATAEEGFLKAEEVHARVLGPTHPNTIDAVHQLARVAFSRGDHQIAIAGFEEALKLREQVLGEDHPLTVMTREWLAKARRRLLKT